MSPDTHSCTDELIFTARCLEGLLGFIHGAVEDDQPLPMRHILFAIGAEHKPCRGRESPCSRYAEIWSPGEEVNAHCPRISFEAISKVGDPYLQRKKRRRRPSEEVTLRCTLPKEGQSG
jgi:hypothetical protein